jgi:ferredoxin
MEPFRVKVDQHRCIGSGLCAELVPAVFALDKQGKAVAKDVVLNDRLEILDAAHACPVRAIVLLAAKLKKPVTA